MSVKLLVTYDNFQLLFQTLLTRVVVLDFCL